MQQRQPRLGDILDDYCPRERRLTNHVVVAMIGDAVKQTRCSTCESDHAYRHAAIPRQRKKSEEALLYAQVLAGVTPKKPYSPADREADALPDEGEERQADAFAAASSEPAPADPAGVDAPGVLADDDDGAGNREEPGEEGPLHRRLIRAQLPRHEGQASTMRQPTDFTIRQPTPPRAKRFGGGHQRGPGAGGGGAQFRGNRQGGTGNGNARGGGGVGGVGGGSGGAALPGGRPPGGGPRPNNRQGGSGRNRPR